MLQKIGYICAELRKPVEDTVYRKVLSKRVMGTVDVGSLGQVYFVKMRLPFGLSNDPSLTFIKIGKSAVLRDRLVKIQTGNPFELTLEDSIFVNNMGKAESIAHTLAKGNHYRGEWFLFSSSDEAQLMIRRIRETLDTYKLIRKIKKSNII